MQVDIQFTCCRVRENSNTICCFSTLVLKNQTRFHVMECKIILNQLLQLDTYPILNYQNILFDLGLVLKLNLEVK